MLSGNIFLVLLGVEAYTETCVEAYSSHLLKKSLMKNFNFCAVEGRDPAYISKYYHIEEPRFSCKMVRCTKKWSSALGIFLVNVTKSRVSADLVTFIKEILNGIFFCAMVIHIWNRIGIWSCTSLILIYVLSLTSFFSEFFSSKKSFSQVFFWQVSKHLWKVV